ncbi:hypothetical protein [Candidatus Blastococcus massiliensis]|uniref:hypothetical protein n=1 Tax=Candidatus Blastococcus massiliensis TaxID=1470358 RepID=UPI000590294A|nr:hypothetical protein [Candidatus Blastococcus massiliensis]
MPVAPRLLSGVVLSATLLLVTACADEEPDRPGPSNEEIAAEIEETLAAREDVAEAEVDYLDEFSNPSTVTARITVAPGADAQALSEEGSRLIWESDLDPLTSFAVYVNDPVEPLAGVSRVVSFGQESERAPLEEKYGPRPD